MTDTSEKYESLQDELDDLRSKIKRLETNREKLIAQVTMKEKKDKFFRVHFDESDLINFYQFDKCDKKLLAILYWEKLTDQQKKTFNDREQMELQKEYERKQQQMMSDPTKMRQYFLKGAAPILDNIIKLANGDNKLSADNYAIREVWEVLKGVIQAANNPAPMMDLRGKDISSQIDEVLSSVSKGDITFIEAKEYMSLISSGFNLQELPKLMAKLEQLEQQ
ncbi:MAG: hypothetical protein KJN70_13990 [Eudoraea sp.]|nr:hypothetical protein [Eudoraea sp.]